MTDTISYKANLISEMKKFQVEDVDKIKCLIKNSLKELQSESQNQEFSKNFLRASRIALWTHQQSITEIDVIFDQFTIEYLRILFLMVQHDVIDAASVYGVIEDIFECLTLKDIYQFFEFLQIELLKHEKMIVTDFHRNQILKICNQILKKLSKITDNGLRGKVRVFLSNILPFSDKSGQNLKSSININQFEIEKNTSINPHYKFYKKFWTIQKYLQNPQMLFSQEEENLDFDSDQDEVVNQEEQSIKPKKNIFQEFSSVVEQILDNLENDNLNQVLKKSTKVVSNEKIPQPMEEEGELNTEEQKDEIVQEYIIQTKCLQATNIFPQYFYKLESFEAQIKDSIFKIQFCIQLLISFFIIKNPIKLPNRIKYLLTEFEKQKISELETKIFQLLYKFEQIENFHFVNQLKKILVFENSQQEWKEKSCYQLEKTLIKPLNLQDFIKLKQNLFSKNFDNDKTLFEYDLFQRGCLSANVYKLIQENIISYRKTAMIDYSIDLFDYLKMKQNGLKKQPIESDVAFYFDKILYDLDPKNEVDTQDKIFQDQIYCWRALRTLSKHSLEPFKMCKLDSSKQNELTSQIEIILQQTSEQFQKIQENYAQKPIIDQVVAPIKDEQKQDIKEKIKQFTNKLNENKKIEEQQDSTHSKVEKKQEDKKQERLEKFKTQDDEVQKKFNIADRIDRKDRSYQSDSRRDNKRRQDHDFDQDVRNRVNKIVKK